ncbi:MAG: RagB/SusD family nutrient uptake outer membrane protein [Flavobacteriaceae bacterium]|nr:MAG: RagB/SusD family nutrient uptake outer membrane protein [Flavobacteriaceae bacterium]
MKIQTIKYISLFAIIGFLSISCSDFLNEEPQSTWGVDDFYSTQTEADIALAGIYSTFASDAVYGQGLSIIMESGTDEGYYNRRYNENWTVGLYRHTSSDRYVANLWAKLYSGINLSNMFIEKLQKDAFEQEDYDRLIGEARFLRAHAYSLLVAWYGDVPMPLTSTLDQTANNLAVTLIADVYVQILSDFTFASEHLLAANDPAYIPGRANKMAAHGLMARAYLKMAGAPMKATENYALAQAQCEIIIQDGYHKLNTSNDQGYRAHFLNYIQSTYDTQESIFEISFAYLREMGINADGRIGGINGVAFNYGGGADGYPGAYALENVSPLLKNIYNVDDQRKDWNIAGYQYTNKGDIIAVTDPLSGQYCPGKFRRWEPSNWDDLNIKAAPGVTEAYTLLEAVSSPSKNFTSINFPVLRYSDVLLMAAEAINYNEGPASAIPYLNMVRNRAGLENIEVTNPDVKKGKDAFFSELVDERAREFCFEGLRKQDLIRWGLLGKKLKLQNLMIEGEPTFKNTNENHKAYLRAGNFYNAAKHNSLPYPLQEVSLNNSLEQKAGW